MKFSVTGMECQLQIEKAIYSMETVHKCFYWLTGEFEVCISAENELFYDVSLLAKTQHEPDFSQITSRIKQSLIDFKLREIVGKETSTIRELIIAKAFANFETGSESPETEISDPVGFNPMSV